MGGGRRCDVRIERCGSSRYRTLVRIGRHRVSERASSMCSFVQRTTVRSRQEGRVDDDDDLENELVFFVARFVLLAVMSTLHHVQLLPLLSAAS